jgi:hypothetical protein
LVITSGAFFLTINSKKTFLTGNQNIMQKRLWKILLKEDILMRLDLGGGTKNTAAPGHINIDLTEDADIQWDLNLGLPNN